MEEILLSDDEIRRIVLLYRKYMSLNGKGVFEYVPFIRKNWKKDIDSIKEI